MNSTSIKRIDQIVIQTENGPKQIHVSEITEIAEEPWLTRFGNWGSLRINNGPLIYFSNPSCMEITRKCREMAMLVDQMNQRLAARANFSGRALLKSTSEGQERSRVTRNA